VSDDDLNLGVACGRCDGPVYMETCPIDGHEWALASECQRCGDRYVIEPDGCPDCHADTEADR
jgi:hypothetical protein